MEQDQKKALDEKTKKLSGGKIEEGKEHAAYQETQQQLLAIQAEQQQNLAVAREESKASFENNQTLAQAAELGAISAAEAEQAAAAGEQAGVQLNPATQQILSKYGAGQPKFQKSQSHSQQVTKQNITINNNITSNTTNDVKVPANIGGPLQGRPLQFKPASEAGSVGKFKTWISAAFAKQNEEGAKRDREYRHRESSLTKSAGRMLKKLEDIGKTIGEKMDPRKIGSTWQSQLKTLLFLFGFGYLTSNWTKILNTVASIENWFKTDFAKFLGIGSYANEESGLKVMIRDIFGGKEGEGILESIGKLLLDKNEGLYGYLRLWIRNAMEERAKAIKLIKFPQLDLDDVIGSIGKIGQYLGDLFGALVGGAEGARKAVGTQIELSANKGALEAMKNDSGTRNTAKVKATVNGVEQIVSADKGIEALFADKTTGKREHYGLTRYSLDENGELTGSTESTYAQSVHLQSAYLDALSGKKAFNTADVSRGIERLYNAAKKKQKEKGHGIPIAQGLLDTLDSGFVDKLKREGKLKLVPYHRVVRKKEDLDYTIEDADPVAMATKAYTNKALLDATGLGEVSDTVASVEGAAAGAAGGAAAGAIGGGVTAAPGALMGGALGWYLGGAMNSKAYKGAKAWAQGVWNKWTTNDYRIEYERGRGRSEEDTKNFYEITPGGIQEVANFLTNGGQFDKVNENTANIDIKDRNFTNSIRSSFEDFANTNIDKLKEDLRESQKRLAASKSWGNIQDATAKRQALNAAISAKSGVDDTDLQNYYKGLDELTELESKYREEEDEYWSNSRMSHMMGGSSGYVPVGNKNLGTSQKARADYAMNRLMQEGLTKEQAAGIVGNIAKESSFNPSSSGMDSNGKWSKGIVQWNGESYKAAERYFGKRLEDVSFEDQLEYLIKEMKGEAGAIRATERSGYLKSHGFRNGANVMDVMKTTTNLNDSTNTFERVFEGSGDYEKERNKTRLEYAATVYKRSGGSLSDLSQPSSSEGNEIPEVTIAGNKNKSEERGEAKSFLEIFKEKVTDLIMNMGGAFGAVNAKINETVSPIIDEAKRMIFPESSLYKGPITRVFTDYEAYKANQNNLPENFPKGLSYAEWKNQVYDMTGSMPQNLELAKEELGKIPEELNVGSSVDFRLQNYLKNQNLETEENPKLELREDSEEILRKYSKGVLEKVSGESPIKSWSDLEIPYFKSDLMKKVEDDKYRELIPFLNDPITRNTLSEEDLANIERVKREDELREIMEDARIAENLGVENLKDLGIVSDENIERIRKNSEMWLEVMEDPGKYRQMSKLMEDPAYKATLTDEELEKIQIIKEMDRKKGVIEESPIIPEIDEDEKSRLMLLAENPETRKTLSSEDLAKVQKIEEVEGKLVTKSQEIIPTASEDITKAEPSSLLSLFDPKNYEKKEDKIETVIDYLISLDTNIGRILNVNSINGTTSAHIVDAVNKSTVANVNASKNIARASAVQQKNTVGQVPSLMGSEKAIKGIA